MAEVGLSELQALISGFGMGFAQVPQGTSIDYPGVDLASGDPMTAAFWQPSAGGFRPVSQIAMVSPEGRIGVWMHAGRPLLWSKDMAAVKRVRRLAGKAATRLGRNRMRYRRGGR